MTSPPSLSVSALGAFRLERNGQPAPKFKYLDARELLVYLLLSSERAPGKSKHEIGAAIWGDLSDAQLNASFKARLHDIRRVLGARDWITFEQEKYRFDFTRPIFFDVREFETSCADAETARRAKNLAAERESLQQALALYRGDFLQDYSTRRKKELAGEREWYLVAREELQNKFRRALERLAQIEFDAARFESALDLLRKLIALDEYDDGAHKQLMLCLALQGKRSQALRHYQTLLKTRADVSPDAELVALFEKIKRNETLVETGKQGQRERGKEGEGDAGFAPANLPPPFQVPADLARFVGRTAQFEILRAAIKNQKSEIRQLAISDQRSAISNLCLVGMGGIGKTSLAIHAAYRLREHFPDGVLWGNLRESEPLAILASWERAYGCDFSGLPDLNARAASFRSLMNEKQVLVIVDDVTDAADARPLLLNGARTRTIFTTRSTDIAAALDARVLEMPVLDADESADLLTRILGHARVAGQEDFTHEICELLGHLPLALDITAQRLVSRPTWTLREMAERLRAQMQRLDELQLADRAVRATFALSWDALNDAQKKVLAHVGVFDARSFTADALAYLVDDVTTKARDTLDSLVALSLLSFENAARYRQHPLLADFSLEQLGRMTNDEGRTFVIAHSSFVRAAQARLSEYYLSFAATNRKNFLSLEEEWDNLNVGIEIAHAQELWQAVIDYGDVLTDAWFARGRFTDARKNYPFVMRAARELEEQDPYINASLNWGKACIDQGDYAEAQEHLRHGLQTSREVNDQYNTANALFLLGRVSVERSEYDTAQKYLEESQAIHERIGDRAGVAETLYMQGRICFMYQEYDKAKPLLEEALDIQAKLTDEQRTIITLRMLSVNETFRRNFEFAEKCSENALARAEKIGDKGEIGAALYGAAVLFRLTARQMKAIDYARASLDRLQTMGDRKSIANIHFLLCRSFADIQKYDAALDEAGIALNFYRELEDFRSVAAILQDMGDIYLKIGRSSDARDSWEQALSYIQIAQHPLAVSLRDRLQQVISE